MLLMELKGFDLVLVLVGSGLMFVVLPLAFYYVWQRHRAQKLATIAKMK